MALQSLKDQFDYRKLLCEHYGIDYNILGEVYTQKLFWQFKLQNFADRLGIGQRLCKDTANLITSGQIRIETPNERLNDWIDSEIFGRLQLPAVLNKNLPYALGLGDMLLTAYRDPADNKGAINYIPIYNVIPVTFNGHSVQKVIWFNVQKIDQEQFIIAVIEEIGKRTVELFRATHGRLVMVPSMTPIWQQLIGKDAPAVVEYNEENPVPKFAWISTGLFNARWMSTPFHNGLIWPFWLINKVEWAWDLLQEELEASRKRIFIDSSLVKSVNNQLIDPITGQEVRVREFDWSSKTYEVVDLSSQEKKIEEYNPNVRLQEFSKFFEFQLKFLATVVGLGPTFYSLENMKVEMTATQVMIQHREAAETVDVIKPNLISGLQTVIYGLIDYALEDGELTQEDLVVQTGKQDEMGNPELRMLTKYDISIQFDDGAFLNRGAKVNEGIQLANSKVGLSDYDLYTKYCNYSKSMALAMIKRKDEDTMKKAQMEMQIQMMAAQMMPQQEQSTKGENK